MKDVVIGDMHFGVKSNSEEWLKLQVKLLDTQVSSVIKRESPDRVVFLGDLGDVRYSLNQMVGIDLKNCIRRLSDTCRSVDPSMKICFIAGNHDYYSPVEDYSKYNIYRLLFGDEFVSAHPNIVLIDRDPVLDHGALMLPWYWTECPEKFDELVYRYDFKNEVKQVYCHADLSVWPGGRIASLHGAPVYSGHIHYIYDDPLANLHNVGAALQLTFADAGQDRSIYIIEDGKVTGTEANSVTPKFVRLFNEEIFGVTAETFRNSQVQLCVSHSNITKAEYIDQLKLIKNTYVDACIRIHELDDDECSAWASGTAAAASGAFTASISEFIDSSIPEHLADMYKTIKERLEKA